MTISPPDDSPVVIKRKKFVWLLVGCWLAVGFVSVAQADFDDGVAAYNQGDYATAFKEFKPLAKQGGAAAQYNLGLLYDYGYGVPQDYVEAVKWYRKAAEQGNAEAQRGLGWLYLTGRGVPQDYLLAHMWLNLAAAQGVEFAIKARDFIAEDMTPDQITEAQKLAREWKPKE